MRYLLMFSACAMAVLIALRFMGDSSAAKPFEGRRIVVITGGRPSDDFATAAREGAIQARSELGCEVFIFASGWDNSQEVTLFQQEMAGAPDGICLIGNPTNEQLIPHIEDALQADIIVTSFHRPQPDMEKVYRPQGFGFAGPDFHEAGFKLIEAAVSRHALPPGSRVLIVADPDRAARDGLADGCMAAVARYGLAVEDLLIPRADFENVARRLQDRLNEGRAADALPDLVCYLQGSLGDGIAALKGAGFKPGEIPLVALGVDESVDKQIVLGADSYVSLLLAQDIPRQVYLAVLQVCLTRQYGASGTHIKTPFKILDASAGEGSTSDAGRQPFVQRY